MRLVFKTKESPNRKGEGSRHGMVKNTPLANEEDEKPTITDRRAQAHD